MELSEINLFPVKSLGGIGVARWPLDRFGLYLDRRWMVVDAQGRFLTQRQHPQMALVRPRLDGERLTLTCFGLPDHHVPAPDPEAPRVPVRVWEDEVAAVHLSAETDAWLAQAIGVPDCRLVWFPEDAVRPVDPRFAGPEDRTAFSDGFPLLLIGEGSLDDLNARLEAPLPMRRFRPNLVVQGAPPYAEDHWRRIRIGEVVLRVVKPCSRCVVTTVDPDTGEARGPEPLRTLAGYRQRDGKVFFGQNLIHETQGVLRVGDPVTVLE